MILFSLLVIISHFRIIIGEGRLWIALTFFLHPPVLLVVVVLVLVSVESDSIISLCYGLVVFHDF